MFKLIFFLIFLLFLNHSLSLSIKSRGKNWIDRQEVQLRDDYKLGWEVDLENKEIIFDVTVQTTGFVGFGLNSMSSMAGADIIIGGVDSGGLTYFEDRHGTENGVVPPIDDVKDWNLITATEESGTTFLKFSRKLDTCDTDDYKIAEDTINVIWSIGSTDQLNGHGTGNRGGLQLNLLDGPKPPFNPDIYQQWEVLINDTMPSADTSYMCTMHKTPNLNKKHHLIAFDTILTDANAVKHTHHFTAFKCTAPLGEDPDEFFGKYLGRPAEECEGVIPSEFSEMKQYCLNIFYVWAVGGQMLIFPEEAGYPISEVTPYDYVLLEIHYDNPDKLEGVRFEAGFNGYYTDVLRQHDAEMLILGLDVFHSQIIPPNTPKFISPGHCASYCTQDLVDPAGINIFAYMFHSHLAGREMKWRVFRDDVEIPWPATDLKYDFNFQQTRNFREPFKMLPGDHTVVECTYSTTGRNVITKGGFSSREEMCEVIAYYYPRGDLTFCSSQTPATAEYYALFGIEEVDMEINFMDPIVIKPDKYKDMSFSEVLNEHVDWTDELRETLRKIQYDDPHITSCGMMDEPSKPVSFPNVISYEPPNQCEIDENTTPTENTTPGETPDRQEVKLRDDYTLGWEVDFENEEIIFDVTVQTTGFVGFGLNSISSMAGADIFIGGVGPEGPYFEDRHGTENGVVPPIDDKKDWTLINATEESGTTFLKFSRKLDTCDTDDYKIMEDTINVIWSIGSTDELTGHGTGNRGGLQLNLLDGPKVPFNPDDYMAWEIRINDTMPSADTSYMCTMHKTPTLSTKHHLIAFETILADENAVKHTHHFTAMKCTAPEGEDADEFFGKYIGKPAGECEGVIPSEFSDLKQYCQNFFYVWAVGGQMLIFPEVTGYPLSEVTQYDYVLLEIHYDNPDKLEGVQFEAGFNGYYTDKLRQHDAEMLILGLDVFHSQVIPPNTDKFISPGHCGPICTNDLIDPAGINIFAYMFHSHLAGREMKWRLFRDGAELPWPATDLKYDFNFQQTRNFREPFKMLPGDHTVVECTYSTTGRNVITKGGLSSREEMCEVLAYYYPRGDMKFCSSQTPATAEYYALFGIEEVDLEGNFMDPEVIKPDKFKGMSFSKVLNENVTWTDELRETLRKIQYEDPHITGCGMMDTPDKPVSFPNVISYVPTNKCDIDDSPGTSSINKAPALILLMILSKIIKLLF